MSEAAGSKLLCSVKVGGFEKRASKVRKIVAATLFLPGIDSHGFVGVGE